MRRLLIAAALSLACAGTTAAQTYPSRSITVVAPFPAGGSLDIIARIVSDAMRPVLGQAMVVENVVGAGGNIGTARVARAAPDGYTIGLGQWSTHVVNPITYSLPYDVLADFEPIALLTTTPQLIVARKDFPAKDVKELVEWLRANPGKATAGSVGAAGGAQVATIYFAQTVGTSFQFVPYKGGGPAIQDMISGRIDFMLDQASNALGPVKSGQVRAYAVMGPKRWAALPDVQALDESGMTGMEVNYWHAMWAPKGTPKEAIAKLNAAAKVALADPTVIARLAAAGHDVFPVERQSPEALAAHHKAEADKWWPIVRASKLKAE